MGWCPHASLAGTIPARGQAPRAGDRRGAIEFLTGFESTYLPGHDDLRLVRDLGIRRLRYPIPWHRIEATRGHYDRHWLDEVLAGMRALELAPIADLVHHTSCPRWLRDGFIDPAFGPAFTAFCAAFAARYPWVCEFTVFNEPLPTTLLCTELGAWPPARRSPEAFYRMALNVARAICTATDAILAARPGARCIHVDTAEAHRARDGESEEFVAHLNVRRFLFHDLILGRVSADHPLFARLRDHGGMTPADLDWFAAHRAQVEVLKLDYYAHCEHQFHRAGSVVPSRAPQSFVALARQYHARYGLPLMLTETNIRGYVGDRISWLKHMVGECGRLEREGIPFEGFTWFPASTRPTGTPCCARRAGISTRSASTSSTRRGWTGAGRS